MGRRPLLERYPRLRARVPHRVLGRMHTPVARLGRLSGHLGTEVWIKRDDLCADPYGGNKSRKLEFLLAQALESGARAVITFGYVGSNHCVATTVHGRRLGLEVHCQLLHLPGWGPDRRTDRGRGRASVGGLGAGVGPLDPRVARNVATIARLGGRQTVRSSRSQLAVSTAAAGMGATVRAGRRPLVIPAGGSSPNGILGYVNAGLELAEQILDAQLPRPAKIYVPFGSAGTTAGLALGLALAGMPVPVQPVAVVPATVSDARTLRRVADATSVALRRHDRGIAAVTPRWLPLDTTQIGGAYGDATPRARAAVRLLREIEGLELEPTYGGKAMAALLEDVRGDDRHARGDRNARAGPLLFWHTYDGRTPPDDGASVPIPRALLPYVESAGGSGSSARTDSTASP